jgi:hypothetical protein
MDVRFLDFDFQRGAFSFSVGGQTESRAEGCLYSGVRVITSVELEARPSDVPGNRIRLRYLRAFDDGGAADEETYPVHWRTVPGIAAGYPDDNTREARIRPAEGRWLECTGEYCWIKAGFPFKARNGEITFCLKTPDVSKESCLELHEENGAMADSTWPIKIGINKGSFFSGFASIMDSRVLGRPFWKSQQALFDDIVPEPDTVYEVRIRWREDGTYRWWVNGKPMTFSGRAKTGHRFSFPGLELPGRDIPFTNERVYPLYGGIDSLALHYGEVTHAFHTVFYGDFVVRSL